MKTFMLIAFLIFGHGVGAQTFEDGVHSVVRGTEGEPHLVKFNSGAVKFIEQDEQEKLEAFEIKLKKAAALPDFNIQNRMLLEESNFEPTIVSDDEIKNIFNRMNPYIRRRSECSDRAHVWAWDEFEKAGLSQKKLSSFLLTPILNGIAISGGFMSLQCIQLLQARKW